MKEKFYKGKLDSKGRYQATARLPEELCEGIVATFKNINIDLLIQQALWHYLTCPIAKENGQYEAIARKRIDEMIEHRLTNLERELMTLKTRI